VPGPATVGELARLRARRVHQCRRFAAPTCDMMMTGDPRRRDGREILQVVVLRLYRHEVVQTRLEAVVNSTV